MTTPEYLEPSEQEQYSPEQITAPEEFITDTNKKVIRSFTVHGLATDKARCNDFNLEKLKSREWLLNDLIKRNNLLYQWRNWAIATTIWPYWNHHIMLIYIWEEENICHIWQIEQNEMNEYYELMNKIIPILKEEYKNELELWEFSLIYWLNHSLHPWWWKSQSVFRPHTQIILIENKEKSEKHHKIEKVKLLQEETSNMWMLALNRQNLAMIKNFEIKFLDTDIQKYKENLFIEKNEYYAIDFTLPWDLTNKEAVNIFENVHNQWRKFLEAIENRDNALINSETLEAIWEDIDKIWFSIWIFEVNSELHLRFRFSFKNKWEHAWVLETACHSIDRNEEKYWSILPDMSRIRWSIERNFK